MSKKQRLDKILSNMGYGSRKEIKSIIKDGRVKVDGITINSNKIKVDPYKAEIEIDGEIVRYREYIYIMMNKPNGVVSSTDDPLNKTVIDIIEGKYRIFNPFPIGRLDKDTEGLLVISNDGKLAHQLLSPKKHVDKTYYVEVEGMVEDNHIREFEKGIELEDGYKTMPAELEILSSGPISKVNLTIKEGKYHQVKRMFKALGMKVVYLKRISMGKLRLDETLELGEYRELTDDELELLKDS
ncbi:pseudouridine synthase [Caldisalinibacter kiritimatiensis]|uniref:Pseudouridine synthase n=1 Tax=Caldisalinibacter kiritimatiensis TaxID=1304284 RepID=R1CSG7_9FIRM|nr:pseudouridine synthase [Caldisalinibacter kiritimatiensis]EOD01601.1 Ribosomal small subunit pseudouridine synthase A [Caldisalinibacter kiritimatiensis]